MSSREPMWYCHECNAEMRPLMMPDPHCASCQGSFVEKMENPEDDPRVFHTAAVPGGDGADMADEMHAFGILAGLNDIIRAHGSTPGGRTPGGRRHSESFNRSAASSPSMTRESSMSGGFRFELSGPSGRRSVTIGGPNVLNRRDSRPDGPPRLSEFLRASNASTGSNASDASTAIPGNIMAQYLMSLLGAGTGVRGSPFFMPMGSMGEGPAEGRMGDYVFSQEALDQIITQIMEGSNSSRPVPAPEDTVADLPREVIEEGSALLEKDCAVCKEQFSEKAEDPDEQVAVTLPCKHPFHEGCIIPWLKSSGTCPVCRFALVPQPNAHGPPGGSGSHGPGPSGSSFPGAFPPRTPGPGAGNGNSGSASNNSNSAPSHGGGFLSSFFGGGSHHHSHSSSPPPPRAGDSGSRRHSYGASSGGVTSTFGNALNALLHGAQEDSSTSRTQRPTSPRRRGSRQSTGESNRHVPGSWD